MRPYLATMTAILALGGCTILVPGYRPPGVAVQPAYVGGASAELVEASRLAWWRSLADPALDTLVGAGLQQNLDIRAALERIVAARENAKRFGLSQQVAGDVSLDARRREVGGTTDDVVNATADAFIVFDLFGEFRSGRARSLAELEATQLDVGTVKLAYLADIVSSYVLARYYQQAAAITRQSIQSRRRTLGSVRQRQTEEEASALEVAQATSLLRTAEATLPVLEAEARVNAFRIAQLLDMTTPRVLSIIERGAGIPKPPGGMVTGLPADLLRNRPDIRASERRLAAATAEIGIAEARLYPSLRLAGSITLGDNDGWSLGPSLDIPVLDLPRRRATRNIARSDARLAELEYRRQVSAAVEEVQAALALVDGRRRQVAALQSASGTADRVLNLSRESYAEGLITLDEVLDAERTRLSNQLDLAVAVSEWAQAWVLLQVALGKGWEAGPGPAPSPALAMQ